MTDGLRDVHREAIIAALAANDRVERAVLFGSRATGTNTVTSDVDIALFGDRLTLADVARLSVAIDEIPMAQSVDLLLYDSVRDRDLRDHIRKEGVEWYARLIRDGGHETVASSFGPANGGWSRVSLGSFVTLQRGHDLPSAVRRPGNTPVLGSFGVTGWHDEPRAAGPGVTVGRSGASFGVVTYSPVDYWPLNTALYVTDFHGNDQRFAYYFLKHFDFRSYNSGSAQPSLNRNFIHPIPVDIPPVAEQRAIAHILGTLDDKIELNRRMNETLEAMTRALFKSWFVDFDPVQANMEGRDTGLPQDISDLFPDRLVDSEVGEIPEGWEVSTIGQEVDAVGGSTPSTKEPSYWSEGRHCWATPKDLSKLRSPVLLDTSRKITDAGLRRISSGTLPVGTVLMSSRAPIGYLAVAEVPTAVNQGFIAMRCERRLPNLYVLFWCYHNLGHIKDIAGGSTFPEISKKAFRPLSVLVPSKPILQAFGRLSHPLHDQLAENMKQDSTLSALRDTILPKLVSGEIRIDSADNAMELIA